MEQLDLVNVHFDKSSLFYLNILLGFLMFGVALDIKIEDFKNVLKNPKAIFLGLLCQYILFPAVTIGLIYLFRPPSSVALGMVLVAACPSGNMANYMTHRARANVTLSVSLNAIIVILAFISTPLVYGIWSDFIPEKNSLTQSISIPIFDMIKIISLLIIIPLIFGVFLNNYYPIFTNKIKKGVSILSLLIFVGFIVGALAANWDNVVGHLDKIFFIVLIHNALGLAIGYFTGKIFSLSEKDCQTLSIESSLHNTALGLILIFQFFNGIGGMAMIAAWYGIWDLIVPFFLTNYWRRKNEKNNC
jgi:bile acid:Na+ symporter, BASS family